MKRSVVTVDDCPRQVLGSPAVKVGDYVFLGGQVAVDPEGGLVPQVRREPDTYVPTIGSKFQSDYILDRSIKILKAAGSSLACGVRIDQFCTHPRAASPYLEARARRIETGIRPASTHVQIDNLLAPGALCGLQLIALTEEAKGKKDVIVVSGMPASPGPPFKPAPHGIIGGDFIFVTGQIAHGFNEAGMAPDARVDPETWYGSPIKLQTDVALKRCANVLNHVGASLTDVVRADVYLNDMDDRFELEEVWQKHFPTDPPARTYIPTVRLGAKSCIVEVNVIAVKPGSGLKKETITARNVPVPDLHHPHAVRVGGFLFVSALRDGFQVGTCAGGARQCGNALVWVERQEADHLYPRLHRVDLPGGRQQPQQCRLDAEPLLTARGPVSIDGGVEGTLSEGAARYARCRREQPRPWPRLHGSYRRRRGCQRMSADL